MALSTGGRCHSPASRRRAGAAWLAVLVLAVACLPAAAGDAREQELRRIDSELASISREQESVYQQFQMVQVLLRTEESQLQPLQRYTPTPPRNYDDVKREESERVARVERFRKELERLYSRHRELEEQKRELLQARTELAQRGANTPSPR